MGQWSPCTLAPIVRRSLAGRQRTAREVQEEREEDGAPYQLAHVIEAPSQDFPCALHGATLSAIVIQYVSRLRRIGAQAVTLP